MKEIRVLELMQTWPQWRTHWHVLHAWPAGAQALVWVFLSLGCMVAGSLQVSSVAWQTWWEQEEQALEWQQTLDDLQLQVNQLRGLKTRLSALPHPSGMAGVAWQSWPDHTTLNEAQLLKDWVQWGQIHGLKVYAVQAHAEHGEGSWRGSLPQLIAAWHGLPQALPRMRVTGFDLATAGDDASMATLVLHMQWVSLKDTPPHASLALKTHMQSGQTKPVESNRDSLEFNPVPLLSKPAYLHNPFSVQSLKSGLPLVASSKTAPSASPLQTKPLSQMQFAGSMAAGEKRQALIGLDGLIYSVSPGERLGQDWGEVTQIEPDHVWLREWFADASGTWVSRERRFPAGDKP